MAQKPASGSVLGRRNLAQRLLEHGYWLTA
jgi:hypothetical protein